jgi:hypothetical protein
MSDDNIINFQGKAPELHVVEPETFDQGFRRLIEESKA